MQISLFIKRPHRSFYDLCSNSFFDSMGSFYKILNLNASRQLNLSYDINYNCNNAGKPMISTKNHSDLFLKNQISLVVLRV